VTAPNPVTGSAAQQAALRELAKREYHTGRPSEGFFERVWDRIIRFLSFDQASGHGSVSAGGWAGLVLGGLFVVAVVVLLVKVGLPKQRRSIKRNEDADPLRPVGARDHRRLAAEFAAAGKYAEAVREWLRAAVQTIEDRGVLTPRPGRTGATIAREAGPCLPGAADVLREAMTAFDEIWFGDRAASSADAETAQRAADAVTNARIRHDAPTPAGFAAPW
jgi:hypothetical protein